MPPSRALNGLRSAFFIAAVSFMGTSNARAENTLIAAATNFADAAVRINRAFEKQSAHRVKFSFGSTGKLYAQVRAGAPFDAFLSADQERPTKLIDAGAAVAGSQFTYAIGQLSLWTMDLGTTAKTLGKAAANPSVRAIAIANPDLAPYGLAARQTLQRLDLWASVKSRIVMGENIGQAFSLVATGNAPIGFVARSQLMSKRGAALGGRRWDVPTNMHEPIRQDAVLLKHGANNAAAKAFMAFLRGTEARAILKRFGYKTAAE